MNANKLEALSADSSFAARGHAMWMVVAGANPREKGIHDAAFGHYGATVATVSFEHEYSHSPEVGAKFADDYANRLVACADAMKGVADPRAYAAAIAEVIESANALLGFDVDADSDDEYILATERLRAERDRQEYSNHSPTAQEGTQ